MSGASEVAEAMSALSVSRAVRRLLKLHVTPCTLEDLFIELCISSSQPQPASELGVFLPLGVALLTTT